MPWPLYPWYPLERGWVGPSTCLEAVVKRINPLPGTEPCSLVTILTELPEFLGLSDENNCNKNGGRRLQWKERKIYFLFLVIISGLLHYGTVVCPERPSCDICTWL
jgi:hypothetical protein